MTTKSRLTRVPEEFIILVNNKMPENIPFTKKLKKLSKEIDKILWGVK